MDNIKKSKEVAFSDLFRYELIRLIDTALSPIFWLIAALIFLCFKWLLNILF